MDGNPLTFEQLVSFAGGHASSDAFPTVIRFPTSQPRHWTWSDTFIGRAIMAYYAFDSTSDAEQVFNFTNSSYADIVPIASVFSGVFGFEKINEDEWDRVDTYVLRRIVAPNGSATRFWPKFETWYREAFPSGRQLVWTSPSNCLRRCQYLLPCFMCGIFC